MRNKTLSFIKKIPSKYLIKHYFRYLNDYSGHLRVNAKLAPYKETFSRYFAF